MVAAPAAAALILLAAGLGSTQPGSTGAEEKTGDRRPASIHGYCTSEGCVLDAVRRCEPSETTISYASNATTIISVWGDAIYQGRAVCTVGVYERDDGAFQSWSCKVPVAELERYEGIGELVSSLAASEHCVSQVT
jgi:hypothetical protein